MHVVVSFPLLRAGMPGWRLIVRRMPQNVRKMGCAAPGHAQVIGSEVPQQGGRRPRSGLSGVGRSSPGQPSRLRPGSGVPTRSQKTGRRRPHTWSATRPATPAARSGMTRRDERNVRRRRIKPPISPITRWSISVLLDRRLCSDQPFRRFPRVHVMLSILRGRGSGAAGVGGRQSRRQDPTGWSGRDLQPQRRAAAARFRRLAPSCAAALRVHGPAALPRLRRGPRRRLRSE